MHPDISALQAELERVERELGAEATPADQNNIQAARDALAQAGFQWGRICAPSPSPGAQLALRAALDKARKALKDLGKER